MRKILGLLFGLILAAPVLAQQSIPAPPVSYQNGTQSWYTINNGGAYLATTSFMAYCAQNGVVCTSGDQTTNVQNYLLAAQLLRYQLVYPNRAYDNTSASANQQVLAVIEPYFRKLTSPIVIPEEVALQDNGAFYRDGTGAITAPCAANWWDGSSCNALNNLFQPMVVGAYNSSIKAMNLYPRDAAGANKGSGYSDRGWEPGAVLSVGLGGSGYNNGGEIGWLANPSSVTGQGVSASVTAGTKVNLTVSGGVVTGATLVSGVRWNPQNGSYNLPPALQDRVYSSAAFIAATGYTTFLNDGSPTGCYKVTGQTSGASNACVRVSWFPDWCTNASGGSGDSQFTSCAASPVYEGKFSSNNVATIGIRDEISIFDAGVQFNDAAYGDMWNTGYSFKNSHSGGQVLPFGGYRGAIVSAIDTRMNILNPTSTPIGAQLRAGQTHINQFIVDSPTTSCAEAGADQATAGGLSTSIAQFECFENGGASAITGYAFDAATLNSSLPSALMGFSAPSMVFSNLGSAHPLINADYWMGGNDLNVIVPNFGAGGGAVTNPSTQIINFGTHITANMGNLITGVGDGMSGVLYTGTWPTGFGSWFWDAYAGGFMGGNGAYQLWGAGAPTNGGSGTGLNKAIAGSTYDDTTNGDLYINKTAASSPTWTRINAPSQPQWRTGHYFTVQGNTLSTTTTGTTGGNMIVGLIPVYVPNPIVPTNLAFEVTTATATGFSARMAVYADATLGSAAPIIDSGTKSVAGSATGVQVQSSGSWTTGAGVTLQPGVYWLFIEIVPVTTDAVRATNFGSPGSYGNDGLGYVLVAGSALPTGPIAGKTIAGLGTSIVTPPSSFTATDAVSGANPINLPIVWIGF